MVARCVRPNHGCASFPDGTAMAWDRLSLGLAQMFGAVFWSDAARFCIFARRSNANRERQPILEVCGDGPTSLRNIRDLQTRQLREFEQMPRFVYIVAPESTHFNAIVIRPQ
ncbi:MAG: hypothetical protein DMG55_01825 [Acidobacteria bacterium]|nr:MAG: hypothetical protein DMG55_01825 [Acidobacteriota bacterium]